MSTLTSKNERYQKRKQRVRKKVFGTPDRYRLSVKRTLNHVYAQIIDDQNMQTLVAASTVDKDLRDQVKDLPKKEQSRRVGELLAKRAAEKNIQRVAFDRNGLIYHGRVKELAEAARENGLDF